MARRTRSRRGGVGLFGNLTKRLAMGKRTAPAAPAPQAATPQAATPTAAAATPTAAAAAAAVRRPDMFQKMKASMTRKLARHGALGQKAQDMQLGTDMAGRRGVGGLKGRKSRRKGRKSRRRGTRKGMRRKTARKAYKRRH